MAKTTQTKANKRRSEAMKKRWAEKRAAETKQQANSIDKAKEAKIRYFIYMNKLKHKLPRDGKDLGVSLVDWIEGG